MKNILAKIAISVAALICSTVANGSASTTNDKVEWPFQNWEYARSYSYNMFPARGGVQMRVLDEGNWSQFIQSKKNVPIDTARRVVQAITSTKGTYVDSKCPFPRHAIVFFNSNDEPVGSVDVCFECESAFAWPDFEISNEARYGVWDEKSGSVSGGLAKEFDRAVVTYKIIFQRLGFSTDSVW